MSLQRTPNISRRSLLLLSLMTILPGCAMQSVAGTVGDEPQDTSKNNTQKVNRKMLTEPAPFKVPTGKEVATLGAGCFWCVEAIFQDLKGVDKVESGYAGGAVPSPSYEQVCTGTTGHAESIQITFDPKVIHFKDILHIFFTTHDPTTLNRQGADHGTQYRSAIFYHTPEQKKVAEEVIKEVTTEKIYANPIVTEVTPYSNFFKAEDYHQNYYKTNSNQGYCRMVIEPKVIKFRQKYSQYLKK